MTELQEHTWADDGGAVPAEPQTLTLTLGAVPCLVELVSYRSETRRVLVRQLEPMTWTDSLGKLVSHGAGTLVDVAAHKVSL
jgi:hypothetical protein